MTLLRGMYKRATYPEGWKPLEATEEQIQEAKAAISAVNTENNALHNKAKADWQAATKLAEYIFGKGLVTKYMEKAYYTIPSPPYSLLPNDIDRSVQEAKAKVKADEAAVFRAEQEEELKRRKQRAILWLQERGLKLGEDFDIDDAYGKANELAHAEEIERRKKSIQESGELISFDGDGNCENCAGWDGESRRCDCGNRRVCWTWYGTHFEDPHVYGEAH